MKVSFSGPSLILKNALKELVKRNPSARNREIQAYLKRKKLPYELTLVGIEARRSFFGFKKPRSELSPEENKMLKVWFSSQKEPPEVKDLQDYIRKITGTTVSEKTALAKQSQLHYNPPLRK